MDKIKVELSENQLKKVSGGKGPNIVSKKIYVYLCNECGNNFETEKKNTPCPCGSTDITFVESTL